MLVVVAVLISKGVFYRPLWEAVYAARVEKVCRYQQEQVGTLCSSEVFMLVRHLLIQQDSQVICAVHLEPNDL